MRCDAFLLAAAEPKTEGEVYNLGGSEVIDLLSLAKLLVEVNGAGSYIIREFPAERHAIDIGNYYSDFSKIRSQLGWEPRQSLRDTIQRTLAFYRDSLSHYV